jgi:hypothetical protein
VRRRHLLFAIAAVILVVAANMAAYGKVAEVDLSASKRFSLASETKTLARAVGSNLQITAFLSNVGGAAKDATFLLARYHELNRRITFKVVDPDANPGEARRFGISRYSTVVLTYRGRRVDATDAQELPISTAILELLRGGTKPACILVGHGEPSLADTSPTGLSQLNLLLTNNAYTPRPLDLTTGTGQVPSDCAAVLIIGPVDPLLPAETNTLVQWARAGGHLMVLASSLTRGDPNPLITPWGIHFVGGLVLDPARDQGLDQSNVIVQDFPSASPVDSGLSSLQFPASGGLVVDVGTRGGLTVEALAVTSSQGFVDSQPDQRTNFGPGDVPGPVPLAAAADDSRVVPGPGPSTPGATHIVRTRVMVTGGELWATNQFINDLSNRRLMLNALAWVTEQEQLVAATSRPNDPRPLPLTPERRARILVITVGLVPGAIIGTGLLEGYAVRRLRRGRGRAERPGRTAKRPTGRRSSGGRRHR